ncbi:hypothetical protein DEO72_LG9g2062 [Vigna unguiculata]|uniref:Uncharacterized protein n=1 Tax=Vigna unguiculata TaxID=3917 RepID=A0A4D6MZY9_VIGUN|nr:hypothetical protein DEO72_LG9g2062 [Vigna unguiculata]
MHMGNAQTTYTNIKDVRIQTFKNPSFAPNDETTKSSLSTSSVNVSFWISGSNCPSWTEMGMNPRNLGENSCNVNDMDAQTKNRDGQTEPQTHENMKIKPNTSGLGLWDVVETRIDRRVERIKEVMPLGDNAKMSEGRFAT